MEGKIITPENVVELLKKEGVEIKIEDAKIMIDFILNIAKIAVDQYLSGRF
ncbi:hypothetical protein [Sphingobacterium detergens]|uniref:Uncharacterized protein n=1 Tax=Sphingobacterium detergens TaxID=1145106 RepID=A0A420ARU4_SPHD1|nr:hypothetical protein [Sphingobacterium detergens]RKE47188.1 hypothetical protein DFQ12_4352 [Sphingobacterium detergens]